MRVRELIAALQSMDPDMEVMTEGCDCWGDIEELRVVDGVVLTCREDGQTLRDERPAPEFTTAGVLTPIREVEPDDMDDAGFRRMAVVVQSWTKGSAPLDPGDLE